MKKRGWKKKITDACVSAGTYKDFFEEPINALAKILEECDSVMARYKETGSEPIVKQPSSTGVLRPVRNPLLSLWDDLNKTALAYWRELGLTPSAYRRLTGEDAGLKPEKKSPLAEALEKLG